MGSIAGFHGYLLFLRQVYIEIDPDNRVGKYGRLLGRIISNGMDVGQEALNLGLVLPFGTKHEGEPESIDKTFSLKQYGLS